MGLGLMVLTSIIAGTVLWGVLTDRDLTRWWVVDEIERALAMHGVAEKDAAYTMYAGTYAPTQWSRAKYRGPIDLVRLAELPSDLFMTVLERLVQRKQRETARTV